MENQTTEATETPTATTTAAGVTDKLKEQVKVVRAQIEAAPDKAKQRWNTVQGAVKATVQQAFVKVRDGLDLPSRKELTSLATRIEELDRKLADLETRETAKKKRKDGAE
jgi:polyhydroxyalkanoate synthesis regulator phasin